MTVYIDRLASCVPNRSWRWAAACHLFADSEDELHDFARRLGLRRAWFQAHRFLPHYDLTAGRRSHAVRLGAVEVGRRVVVDHIRAARRRLHA